MSEKKSMDLDETANGVTPAEALQKHNTGSLYFTYLKESEDRFRDLLDTAPFGVLEVSMEGKILLASPQCAALHQVPHPDELMGVSVTDLIAAVDRKLFSARLGLLVKSHERQQLEILMQRRDGTTFHCEVWVSLQCNTKGQPIVFTIVERDLSAFKAAHEEIQKMSLAVEQSASAIVITDSHGRVEYVNRCFTTLTGYRPGDVIGRGLAILKAGQHSPDEYQSMAQAVRAGRDWRGVLRNEKKNGDLYWSREMVSPVKDANGVIRNYLTIQEDISEHRAMEEELREKHEQLKAAMDTLSRSQVRLIEQEKMAGVGQLAAGVAHEINNPLGFVISNFGSLEKYLSRLRRVLGEYRQLRDLVITDDPVAAREQAERVESLEKELKMQFILDDLADLFHESHEGLERVRKIVKGLRTFARIDSATVFEPYDLNEGLQETLVVAKNEVKHSAVVEEDYGALPLVSALGGRINQVLLNLIVNAAQAIRLKHGDGMGSLRLHTWADDESVYCAVEDNGPGVPSENREKLFEPFFTTKPAGQGTGLGLSISYDIVVNKHHGEIWAENRPEGGARFVIRLPQRQLQNDEDDNGQQKMEDQGKKRR
ncbi:MAG TPA: PAS domain S-box protein [Patescibacteria group bacterium]|nr:PAS domain S-box protein [Patescibacteria group bacterium]